MKLMGAWQRIGAATALCYAATATVFPNIFALGCVLPAVLAVIGAATVAKVYRIAHSSNARRIKIGFQSADAMLE
jgi:hypothetical protein